MKKRIIAILLAVVLVAGGLGGFAYAQVNGHEPMTGQKLVGHGAYGVFPPEEDGTYLEVAGSVTVTNPDCVSKITIDRISIFDFEGIVIYEGDLFSVDWVDEEPVVTYWTEPLKPHEQRWIEVDSTMVYLRDQGRWEGDHIFFTVEIFWRWTDKEGLPLTGWAGGRIAKRAADGHIIEFQSGSATQMVNMEQVLEPAKEKEVTTLRLQTWFGPEEPFMEPLENFAQAVADGTKGSVRIKVYSSDALVPNPELAEAVRQGTVEMGLIYSVFLQDSPSLMDAPQLPFLYNNEDGLMAAVEDGIGDLMTEQIKDMTVLGWTTTAFSHLYNRLVMADEQVVLDHPIIHPDDVAGLKIRSMNIPAEAITEWLGHSVFIPWGAELYQALDGGKIDGAIHSPYLYEELCLYEVAPYFCVGYAFAELSGLCINSKVWKDMDADTQQIITEAAGDYADEMLETAKLVGADALQQIQQHLPEFPVEVHTLSPAERLVWREASQPVWDSWVSAVGKDGEDIIAIALENNPLPEIP